MSKVTAFTEMFKLTQAFNQPLNAWGDDLESALYVNGMFESAQAFNRPLNSWDVSNIRNFNKMFFNAAAFNQSIGNWTFKADAFLGQMLYGTGLSCANVSTTLHGWASNPNTPNNLQLIDVPGSYGPLGQAAYNKLKDEKGWNISGGTYDENCDESSLPVHFGPVTATLKNNELLVNWYTLSETNNSYLEIEASENGVDFTTIGRVSSKAENGNADKPLEYSFSISLQEAIQLSAGILPALLALLALSARVRRRKITVLAVSLAAVFLMMFAGCKKYEMSASNLNPRIYVRIAQVDKDGTTSYSKVVVAVVK